MSSLSPQRVSELLNGMPWTAGARLRVVWVHVPEGSRAEYARAIASTDAAHVIVTIVVREQLFRSANAVLSDLNRLFEQNKSSFASVPRNLSTRLTVALLSKDTFDLPQISSPIVMPHWFPVLGGQETFLRVGDLLHDCDVDLVNCPESRIGLVSELVFEVERGIVVRAERALSERPRELDAFVALLYEQQREKRPQAAESLGAFRAHLDSVLDARAYRVSAKRGASLAGRLVRLIVRSSPEQLAANAKIMAAGLGSVGPELIKPSLLGVLLRPPTQLNVSERNWHAVLVGLYQAYQLNTAAAHAGDYGPYPVGLIEATSRDLARVLRHAVQALSTIEG